jgi:hypothetical protein
MFIIKLSLNIILHYKPIFYYNSSEKNIKNIDLLMVKGEAEIYDKF